MSIEIRSLVTPEEVDAGFAVFLRSMVGLPIRDIRGTEIAEPGRYLGAVDLSTDGATVVGSADSYSSTLVVPGGARVPHAAVTHVGVLPTHRRRGLAGRLLERQLQDVAARGEVAATLRASEAVIYERFGYGVATSIRSARVDLHRARLRPDVPAGGDVRIVDDAVTRDLLHGITDASDRAGSVGRRPEWWTLGDHLRGRGSRYVVVHRTDGQDDGFAVYHPEDTAHWFGGSGRTVTVTDLVALTDTARAGLWRHLLDLDLVDVVALDAVPLDDPLPLAVTDRRAVELGPERDETWLRLVDVEAALQARTYGDEDPVVLQVDDAVLPTNRDRYAIGPKSVSRTDADPDLALDVAVLAQAYLGGTRWHHLAAAGRVAVHRPEALERADRLFATPSLPFSGVVF